MKIFDDRERSIVVLVVACIHQRSETFVVYQIDVGLVRLDELLDNVERVIAAALRDMEEQSVAPSVRNSNVPS